MNQAARNPWLNYHHLFYFWTAAQAGSISRASRELRLAQPTVSTQIKQLENTLGDRLFDRSGRRLVLTDAGRVVHGYAQEIFGLGRDMLAALDGRPGDRAAPLNVGISDVVPKLIAYRLLAPALGDDRAVRLLCREDKTERLLAELSVNGLDVVISDEPLPAALNVKAYNHLLGECGFVFFGVPQLARKLRGQFPHSLADAPMILPSAATQARRSIDYWLQTQGIRPRIIGEFDDSALLKVFGEHGAGVFAAPAVLEDDIRSRYHVEVVGRTNAIREQFYLISVERRVKHPALVYLMERARGLFAPPKARRRSKRARRETRA